MTVGGHAPQERPGVGFVSGDLRIDVDVKAAEPPFEQVRAQIAGLITSGRLLPGDRLPTVRALAADLGLAANTVARSYKELEATGLVETGRRAGTVVASGAHTADIVAATLATKFAIAARSAGLDDGAAIGLVRAALRDRPNT
ncbi:MAG: GntR family transcriptional regulator [Intrasporangium sp.]|uniref:GntR family transcriptional regulator n=1 Tax=Intrasporangium sp. TaxID=1925024 RepID=UPI002647580F|nr:GntR family transcriptional regulator [Intrasporangium sp.]MDN5794835.1 GntR family transcriptional regulator [Intrasporangium sp.]